MYIYIHIKINTYIHIYFVCLICISKCPTYYSFHDAKWCKKKIMTMSIVMLWNVHGYFICTSGGCLLLGTGLPGSQRPCLVQNATAFVTVAFDGLNDFFELVGDVLEKSGEKHVILLIHLVEWTQNGHVIHSPHHFQDIPTRSGFNHGPRGLICTHVQRGICQWYNLLTWPCLQLVCIEEQ